MSIAILMMVIATAVYGNSCNGCSGHGKCEMQNNVNICVCDKDKEGLPMYDGSLCQYHTCPKGNSWVGTVVNSNNVSPSVECCDKGLCNRKTGECDCFSNFEGASCDRQVCPNACSNSGRCLSQLELAEAAKATYSNHDGAMLHGCQCDLGTRGPDCSLIECPTGADPVGGKGADQGKECSGRGTCDYSAGECTCFQGYRGTSCQLSSILG